MERIEAEANRIRIYNTIKSIYSCSVDFLQFVCSDYDQFSFCPNNFFEILFHLCNIEFLVVIKVWSIVCSISQSDKEVPENQELVVCIHNLSTKSKSQIHTMCLCG